MATMTEGEPPSHAVTQLEAELQALLRKRSQYRVALETASDSRIITRMVADLKRLDDEITGFEEALAAVPQQRPSIPPSMALRPTGPASKASGLTFETSMPDWDDEPATTLYDGASRVSLLPSAPPGIASKGATSPSSISVPSGERIHPDRPRISEIEHSPFTPSSSPEPVSPGASLASLVSVSSAPAESASRGASSALSARPGSAPLPESTVAARVDEPSGNASSSGTLLSGEPSSGALLASGEPSSGASPVSGEPSSSASPASVQPPSGASLASGDSSSDAPPASSEPSEPDSALGGGTPALPSIHELEALEARTQWNSDLSPASFRLSEDDGWEPTLRTHAVPRLWLAVGGATLLVVLVLVWALA